MPSPEEEVVSCSENQALAPSGPMINLVEKKAKLRMMKAEQRTERRRTTYSQLLTNQEVCMSLSILARRKRIRLGSVGICQGNADMLNRALQSSSEMILTAFLRFSLCTCGLGLITYIRIHCWSISFFPKTLPSGQNKVQY